MFNCLPGAMLEKGHTHQCQKGFSCSRVHSQHNARMTASHRLFNPGRPGGKARKGLWVCATCGSRKIQLVEDGYAEIRSTLEPTRASRHHAPLLRQC
jgi:hypothetical protein